MDDSTKDVTSTDYTCSQDWEVKNDEVEPPSRGMPDLSATLGDRKDAPFNRQSTELPPELRVKLRKLDRLEGKYQDLLKAYRFAHARVQKIDPFEASLRENTPLTSINDPDAFLEYINQITLKSNLVLDELKVVTTDRESYRKRFHDAEKELLALKDEVSMLDQQKQASTPLVQHQLSPNQSCQISNTQDIADSTADKPKTHATSPSLPTSPRIPSFSLFPTKSKAVISQSDGKGEEAGEEFFSYDSELPQLQAEMQERESKLVGLQKEVAILQRDLSVARESTGVMVQNLEDATQQLHAIRDANEQHELARSELQMRIECLQRENSALTSENAAAKHDSHILRSQIAEIQEKCSEKMRLLHL